jgi:hypothetical protein
VRCQPDLDHGLAGYVQYETLFVFDAIPPRQYVGIKAGTDKNGKPIDMTFRVSDGYKKINGKWMIVEEHLSFPVDVASGKADLSSKP